jgi:tetratricopeptide (TPR) repeat protein
MGFFNFFKKKEKAPPKEVRLVFEKMKRQMEGRKLADQAISYRNVGNYDKAFSLLEMALVDFGYKPAITLIGTTKVLQGDIEGAIEWFSDQLNTLREDGDYPVMEIYANLGSIYNKYLHDYTKALYMYNKALDLPRLNSVSEEHYRLMLSNVHHDMAIVYVNLGELSLAREYAKKRLGVQPDCADSKAIMAHITKLSDDAERSERDSEADAHSGSTHKRFVNQPPCGTVTFDEHQKATLIMVPGMLPTHSLGHVLLRDLYRSQDEALPQYRPMYAKFIQNAERWAGVSDGHWSEEQEEEFVNQFERWAGEKFPSLGSSTANQAISPALRQIFEHLCPLPKKDV